MTNDENNFSDLLARPPAGFSIEQLADHTTQIRHKRTGMVSMNIFIVIFIVVWLYMSKSDLKRLFYGVEPNYPASRPWVFGIMSIVVPCILAALLVWSIFCRTTLNFEANSLAIEWKVFFIKWKKLFRKDEIQYLTISQDGGKDEDSFPSWALELKTKSKTKIISRQAKEKSDWLAKVIATWANVPVVDETVCELPSR